MQFFSSAVPVWIGPILAALVTATVALVALFRTLRENRKLQQERQLGERSLAEWKANADLALAERKFTFDRDLVDIRRKTELAETALTLAYEARDVIRSARSPGMRSGEGGTRQAAAGEETEVAERRNTYFVPIERLNREASIFARLQSVKYPLVAYFGPDAAKPVADLLVVQFEIMSAASILIQMAAAEDIRSVPTDPTLSQIAFATAEQPDGIAKRVDAAVEALEALCGPILRSKIAGPSPAS